MKRIVMLLLIGLMCGGAARAADSAPAKPAAAAKKAAKPASARGPGTQTEDELYIGARAKTPQKVKAKPSARAKTGDEDLEDLEVQRFGSSRTSK